jgi:hypothetical protein
MPRFFTFRVGMTEPVDLYYINRLQDVGKETKEGRIGFLLYPIIEQRQYSMGSLPYLLPSSFLFPHQRTDEMISVISLTIPYTVIAKQSPTEILPPPMVRLCSP